MNAGGSSRGRVVVWGLLAHAPFGGMVWQVMHHLIGLQRLGYDVWYVEDSDQRMLDLDVRAWTVSAATNAAFAHRYLHAIGFGERWVIRHPGSRECFGALDWDGLNRLYRDADLVVNLCGSHELRAHHDDIARLVYIETDPGANQVALASGVEWKVDELARYEALATYATNLGADDCLLPSDDRWIATVPPVVISAWSTHARPTTAYSTIMNWSSPQASVTWKDRTWEWSKRPAQDDLTALPSRSPVPLSLALRQAPPDLKVALTSAGWNLLDARGLDRPGAYRRFIRDSTGEISIAKQQYVAPRTGWVSDRTVCYLAAGRPAVVQRTGIAGIPLGVGMLDFDTPEEAGEQLAVVAADYPRHAAAALDLATEYFGAEKVLSSLLQKAGLD